MKLSSERVLILRCTTIFEQALRLQQRHLVMKRATLKFFDATEMELMHSATL